MDIALSATALTRQMVGHHQPTSTLGDSHRVGVLETDEPMKVKVPLKVNQLRRVTVSRSNFSGRKDAGGTF